MPARDSRFHLIIGSRFENIELVQGMLCDALMRAGCDEEGCHWIDLAVREAVANAIKHGNRQDPDKPVEVDVDLSGGELVVRVEDCGEGFELADVADPLAPDQLLAPNGRGLFYMQSFMDAIDYSSRPGGGTVVTLRKSLPRQAAVDADGDEGDQEEGPT
jgi:serine/threonine-protein kinase RsbW